MASPAFSPGRTRRQLDLSKARNGFERTAWIFMRYSGLILVFLALSHFWMQHIIIGTHNLTVGDTELHWGINGRPITIENVIWRAYYAIILALAMLHGLNGLRQVAFDYVHSRVYYRAVMTVAAVLIGVVSLGGFIALLMGASVVTK